MSVLRTAVDTRSGEFATNSAAMRKLVDELREKLALRVITARSILKDER